MKLYNILFTLNYPILLLWISLFILTFFRTAASWNLWYLVLAIYLFCVGMPLLFLTSGRGFGGLFVAILLAGGHLILLSALFIRVSFVQGWQLWPSIVALLPVVVALVFLSIYIPKI